MNAIQFKDIQATIGTIIAADDPKKLGRIKVAAPGIFDLSVMDEEAIPWVYPLIMFGFQSYSRMQNGSKVWLIWRKGVLDEYWYLPFHELNEDTKAAINDDEESDVLISRQVGDKQIQIYHNKTEGLIIKYDKSQMTFNQEGQILIDSNGTSVKIDAGKIYLGATEEDEFEQMVRGTVLNDLLSGLASDLNMIGTAAQGSPYTGHMTQPIQQAASNINTKLNDLLSGVAMVGK